MHLPLVHAEVEPVEGADAPEGLDQVAVSITVVMDGECTLISQSCECCVFSAGAMARRRPDAQFRRQLRTASGVCPARASRTAPRRRLPLLDRGLHERGQGVRGDAVQADAVEADDAESARAPGCSSSRAARITPTASRSLCATIAVGRLAGSASRARPAIVPSSTVLPAAETPVASGNTSPHAARGARRPRMPVAARSRVGVRGPRLRALSSGRVTTATRRARVRAGARRRDATHRGCPARSRPRRAYGSASIATTGIRRRRERLDRAARRRCCIRAGWRHPSMPPRSRRRRVRPAG